MTNWCPDISNNTNVCVRECVHVCVIWRLRESVCACVQRADRIDPLLPNGCSRPVPLEEVHLHVLHERYRTGRANEGKLLSG